MTSEHIAKEIVEYLKKHNRYDMLPQVVKELESEVYKNQDITIVSAIALNEDEKSTITKLVVKKWGDHSIHFYLDPALLTGLLIKFQDKIIDMSGKYSLSQLRQELHTI